MSKAIIVSENDIEYEINLDSNEDVLKILNNMLGNILHCTFSFNGKVISMNDLAKEIRDTKRVDVTRCANISTGLQDYPVRLTSQKNPARPMINIESVHISCSSDVYNPNEDMTGLIIYSFDNQQDFRLNGHHCRAGYILIKLTKNLSHIQSNQATVHGSLFKWFFGIEPDNRFVGAGFTLVGGTIKFNTSAFNAKHDDYHDESKVISANEIALIKTALNGFYINNKWQQKSTQSVKELAALPIQNHPKT